MFSPNDIVKVYGIDAPGRVTGRLWSPMHELQYIVTWEKPPISLHSDWLSFIFVESDLERWYITANDNNPQ